MPRLIIKPIGPSIAYVPLTRGMFALIDSSNVARLGEFSWRAHRKEDGLIYAVAEIYNSSGKRTTTGMHVFLLKPPKGCVGDHINGNTLDYRESNLRIANNNQSAANRSVQARSLSGYKGVHQEKRCGRWIAQIQMNGVRQRFGPFDTAEEASAAYLEESRRLHGEFARRTN